MINKNENITKRIQNVSKEYIFKYGIRGWNMNDFANEAGITKRTLYKYVESKEILVELFILDYIKDTQSKLLFTLEKSDNFHKRMVDVIEIYPALVVRLNSKTIQDIFLQYPSIEHSVSKKRDEITQRLHHFIRNAQNNGEINSSYDYAEILEIIQALIIFYAKNHPNQLEAKLKQSIRILYYGLQDE